MHTELILYANRFLERAQKLCPADPDLGRLRDSSEWLDASPFRILVAGDFNCGKSTFINAWLGKKLLPTSMVANTKCYTAIRGSENTEEVTIHYWDPAIPPKKLPLEALNDPSLSYETYDERYIASSNHEIKLLGVTIKADFSSRGIEVIDSPGFAHDWNRKILFQKYMHYMNAVIFVLSACAPFKAIELEYLKDIRWTIGKNIFFIFTRVDCLTEGDLENALFPYVQKKLADVFVNDDGDFDEDLFNRRVFFLNAYGALCVRTGDPYRICLYPKEVVADIRIENTGFPEFEAAFHAFYQEWLGPIISIMDSIYGRAALMITPHSPQPSVRHSHRNQQPETKAVLLQTMCEYLDACKALAGPS